MTIAIHAEHLCKSFGNILAVDDLSLVITPGEIYGLVGSDGAGKTTTMRLLVGALKPDSGEASICGHRVNKQSEQARACLGYLSQRFSLYEELTVLENIRFFAEVRGLTREEWLPRCMEILEFVGLDAFKDRRAGALSGGMKQKLGLASALVTRPRVLLLDEPTTGVDPVTRQDFWQLLTRLTNRIPGGGTAKADQDEGVAVILSTPYMDEASRCHRVGFMRAGRLLLEGTPSQLRSTLAGRIIEVRGKGLMTLRKEAEITPGVEEVCTFGDRLHLRVNPNQAGEIIASLISGASSNSDHQVEASLIQPTLEDVFIAMTAS